MARTTSAKVMWLGGYNSSLLMISHEAIAAYGNIVFGGNGTYTLTAKAADAAENTVTSITGSGTYTIASSGWAVTCLHRSTPFTLNLRAIRSTICWCPHPKS